jgi:hypothetical protein
MLHRFLKVFDCLTFLEKLKILEVFHVATARACAGERTLHFTVAASVVICTSNVDIYRTRSVMNESTQFLRVVKAS